MTIAANAPYGSLGTISEVVGADFQRLENLPDQLQGDSRVARPMMTRFRLTSWLLFYLAMLLADASAVAARGAQVTARRLPTLVLAAVVSPACHWKDRS